MLFSSDLAYLLVDNASTLLAMDEVLYLHDDVLLSKVFVSYNIVPLNYKGMIFYTLREFLVYRNRIPNDVFYFRCKSFLYPSLRTKNELYILRELKKKYYFD